MSSAFDVHAQALLDAQFDSFGAEALWTPQGGQPKGVRLRPDDGSGDLAFTADGRQIATVRRVYGLRVSEAAAAGAEPKYGDRVELGEEVLKIVAKPERRDRCRLVWTLELDKG